MWTMFLSAWVAVVLSMPAAAVKCYSCASTVLREQWVATGLPAIPSSNFNFTDECKSGDASKLPKCDGDSCLEMVLPNNSKYVAVRGCLSAFQGDTTVNTISKGNITMNVTLVGGKVQEKNVVYLRYCSYTDEGTSACNMKLPPAEESPSSPPVKVGVTVEQPTFNCISCGRWNDKGKCDKDVTTTCTGNWCLRSTGYMGGVEFEVRGCAPFNPLGLPTTKIETYVPQFVGGLTINNSYSAYTDYCVGDRCNGGTGVFVLGCTLLAAVIGASLRHLVPQ